MNRHVVPSLLCRRLLYALVTALLSALAVSVQAQSIQELRYYNVPSEVYQIGGWTGLTATDSRLLKKAMAEDLAQLSKGCDESVSFEDVDASAIDLGKFGKGLVARVNHPCLCKNGNCPVVVAVKEQTQYRIVLRGIQAWGYALFQERTDTPDVVLASHVSQLETTLLRFHLSDGILRQQNCETAVSDQKDSEHWNPKAMALKPCTKQ
jgi:hypothetical protein